VSARDGDVGVALTTALTAVKDLVRALLPSLAASCPRLVSSFLRHAALLAGGELHRDAVQPGPELHVPAV
jgi:hypothetical protein